MLRALRVWIAAAVLTASASAAAQVPDPFARELAQRLTQSETLLIDQGFVRAAGPFPGGLAPRQSGGFPLSLRAGQEYGLVAVCSSRCVLDLRLLDPEGTMSARAIPEGAGRVLRVRPRLTGAHRVEVEAVRCDAPSCWYAVNVYAR